MNISDYQLCEHGGKLENWEINKTGEGDRQDMEAETLAGLTAQPPLGMASHTTAPLPTAVSRIRLWWKKHGTGPRRRIFFCHQRVFRKRSVKYCAQPIEEALN